MLAPLCAPSEDSHNGPLQGKLSVYSRGIQVPPPPPHPTDAPSNPDTPATNISITPNQEDRIKDSASPGNEPGPRPTTPSRVRVQTAPHNGNSRRSLWIFRTANGQRPPVMFDFPPKRGVQLSLWRPPNSPGARSEGNRDYTSVKGAILQNSPATTLAIHHGSPMVQRRVRRGDVTEHQEPVVKERRSQSEEPVRISAAEPGPSGPRYHHYGDPGSSQSAQWG